MKHRRIELWLFIAPLALAPAIWAQPIPDPWAGYKPNQWYDLDTRYGTRAELKDAIAGLDPVKALAAVARNDECGCGTGEQETGPDASVPYARDLDHFNASVREEVVKWLRFLKEDIGFASSAGGRP